MSIVTDTLADIAKLPVPLDICPKCGAHWPTLKAGLYCAWNDPNLSMSVIIIANCKVCLSYFQDEMTRLKQLAEEYKKWFEKEKL